jgi:hypothetical protein
LSEALSGYLTDYFSYDRYIEAQGIAVTVDPLPGDEQVRFKISYVGNSTDGRTVELSTGMEYSIDSGAFLSVDYNPKWLETPTWNEPEVIQFPVSIASQTNEIELPKEPYPAAILGFGIDSGVENALPIYLLLSSQLTTLDTSTEEEFTIDIRSTRSKYQISTAVPSYARRGLVIESYEFTSNPDNLDYFVVTEYGEPTVIVNNRGAGTLTGTATFKRVVQLTETYSVKNSIVTQPVFPMRRHRGKYFAEFPKTIQIGDYYISYTAISEE